jgi:hypothetical protein
VIAAGSAACVTVSRREALAAVGVRRDHKALMMCMSCRRRVIASRHHVATTRRRRMTFGPGETDPSQHYRGDGVVAAPQPPCVTFERRELDRIFGLYGRMVAAGEWRDYAIDFLRDRAVFSVFRHAAQVPIYRIEKNPKLSRRQGAFSVITATGLIMRRSHELDRVLRVLDKPEMQFSLVVN